MERTDALTFISGEDRPASLVVYGKHLFVGFGSAWAEGTSSVVKVLIIVIIIIIIISLSRLGRGHLLRRQGPRRAVAIPCTMTAHKASRKEYTHAVKHRVCVCVGGGGRRSTSTGCGASRPW